MGLFNVIAEAGLMGFAILTMGIIAIGLACERFYTLYQKYSFDTQAFTRKIYQYVRTDKVEEAIALCSQMGPKPFASAFKTILEHTGKTDDHIMQAQDIALSETVPRLTAKLGYLNMIANVSTLVGLLGTIQGLIMSFSAVATADPASKQTLLAEGISVAMYTTALGLAVAIPTMVIYSILHAKQNKMIGELNTETCRLVELLTDSLPSELLRGDSVLTEAPVKMAAPQPPNAEIKSA